MLDADAGQPARSARIPAVRRRERQHSQFTDTDRRIEPSGVLVMLQILCVTLQRKGVGNAAPVSRLAQGRAIMIARERIVVADAAEVERISSQTRRE